MKLDTLHKLQGRTSKAKRRGRGIGSGKGGHTTGSGIKGQKSRKGNSIPVGFEGGQEPLFKKLPQIGGFKSHTAKKIANINLSDLNKFKDNTSVSPNSLVAKGMLIKLPKHGVKILNTGKIEKKLTLTGFMFSAGSRAALIKAGCTIE